MKLQNKETGKVENFCIDKDQICSCNREFVYDSIKQLQQAGWEDYKEPKGITDISLNTGFSRFWRVQIDYDNKEQAEKAVEKLKAFTNLCKNGFKFTGWDCDKTTTSIKFNFIIKAEANSAVIDDLDLLFDEQEYIRKIAQKIVEEHADYYDKFGGEE